MVQWINTLLIIGFVNPIRLPFLCKKAGALAIVEPGLTAGKPAVWQAVRQTNLLQSKEIYI